MSEIERQEITSNGTDIPEPISPDRMRRTERKQGYWHIVWRQLKKNRFAVFGMYCVAFLVFVAVLTFGFIVVDCLLIFVAVVDL